jgi:hypothetical protein
MSNNLKLYSEQTFSCLKVVLGKTSKISKLFEKFQPKLIFEKWLPNFFFEFYFFEKKLFEIKIFRKYIRKFRKILNFHGNRILQRKITFFQFKII